MVRATMLLLATWSCAQLVWAVPHAYAFGKVVSIDMHDPCESGPMEDKRFFDCVG